MQFTPPYEFFQTERLPKEFLTPTLPNKKCSLEVAV
jgi:hypothetical protein